MFFAAIAWIHAQYNPESDFYFEVTGNNDEVRITGFAGGSGEVNIPPHLKGLPVTAIGREAFAGIREWDRRDDEYVSVRLVRWLTAVSIPNGVRTIDSGAFEHNKLTSIVIPDSVVSIGNHAFAVNRLTSVVIPDGVTRIGNGAFASNQLTSLVIGNSVETIGSSAFANNLLTNVIIPDSVADIASAFTNNQLTNVTIGSSVRRIGVGAFDANNLTSIVIPNNVRTIETSAFVMNPLTSITIGANVHLWNNAFVPGFDATYNNGGRLAGTYTRPNTGSNVWTRQE